MLNFEEIGQGKTTKIYRDGNIAIKLYENTPLDEVEKEAALQRFAYDAGLPIPIVYGIRNMNENSIALYMEYINGLPLMHPDMDKNERKNAIHTLVKLQREVNKVKATGLPTQANSFIWKINESQYLSDIQKKELLNRISQLYTDSENLCHGDFHPLNILFDGKKHFIIDWVDATAGNPLADACRTYIILKQHISRLAGIYLKQFCIEAKVNQDDVLAWLPVIAAVRLRENMDDKARKWLLDIILNQEL